MNLHKGYVPSGEKNYGIIDYKLFNKVLKTKIVKNNVEL